MRIAVAVSAGLAVLSVGACAPVDTSADGVAVAPDAGPVWTGADGGSDGGAGAGGGPGPDGGAADAGAPDAGGAGGTASACEGIVPPQNPTGRSVRVARAPGGVCWNFTSDQQGTVAGESHAGDSTPRWQLWSADAQQSGARTPDLRSFAPPARFSATLPASSPTPLP